MNLVFNTFITDEALNGIHGPDSPWQRVRQSDTTFRQQSKLDIFKFTLDSYTHLRFAKTYFWVQCEDSSKHEEINAYILARFPGAYINNKRCLTYAEYQTMLEVVPKDDWIFFSPNNDHVFWSPHNVDGLLSWLTKAAGDIGRNCDNMVGIFYSHWEEFLNLAYPDTWFGRQYNTPHEPRSTFDDTPEYVAFSSLFGENTSVQILHPDLFRKFFLTYNFGDAPIRRIEDLRPMFHITGQVSIVPKQIICAHFDGQPSLHPYIIPPLFIPNGYWDGEIRIAVDQRLYDKSALNISSRAKLYSYLDPRLGTDFIGAISDLPRFFQGKLLCKAQKT